MSTETILWGNMRYEVIFFNYIYFFPPAYLLFVSYFDSGNTSKEYRLHISILNGLQIKEESLYFLSFLGLQILIRPVVSSNPSKGDIK